MTPGPGYRHAPEAQAAPPPRIRAFEAIQFPFRSPAWLSNLLIGLVYLVIPIVGPIALRGYASEIQQRLVRGHPEPIPKLGFADLSHYLERGVAAFVLELLVLFPLVFATMTVLGVGVGLIAAAASSGVGGGILAAAGVALAFVTLALTFLSNLVHQGAAARVEITEDVGLSLSPQGVWDFLKRTGKPLAWASLAYAFLATGLAFGGFLCFFIGIYPAVIAIQLGSTHLRHQAYRVYLAEGGVPLPMKPPRLLPSEAQRLGPMPHGLGPPPGPYAPPGAYPAGPPPAWGPPPQAPPGAGWPPNPPGGPPWAR